LSQCIYGGKIDNDYDQRLLTSFLSKLFTARSFETGFALVANVDGVGGDNRYQLIYSFLFKIFKIDKLTKQINFRHIPMPNGSRRDHFLHWIENLSDRQSPSWLGLPNNAEKVLLTTRGMSRT